MERKTILNLDQLACRYRDGGGSLHSLAKETLPEPVTHETLRKRFMEMGVSVNRPGRRPGATLVLKEIVNLDELVRRYRDGTATLEELAREARVAGQEEPGVLSTTLRRRLVSKGVAIRPPGQYRKGVAHHRSGPFGQRKSTIR